MSHNGPVLDQIGSASGVWDIAGFAGISPLLRGLRLARLESTST
jgi:hypothetical protein